MSATHFLSAVLEDAELDRAVAQSPALQGDDQEAALTAAIELLGSQVVVRTVPAAPRFAEALLARAALRREDGRLDDAEDDAELAVRTWGWLAGELDDLPQGLAAAAGLPTVGPANTAVSMALHASLESPDETWLPGLVAALVERSRIEAAQGTLELARVSAEAAQERAEWLVSEWSEDCRPHLATTLGALAERDIDEGDDLAAADNYDEQAAVYADLEADPEEGMALLAAGRLLLDSNDTEGARARLTVALQRLRPSAETDPSTWARPLGEALEARALCAMDEGDVATAARISQEAASVWEAVSEPAGQARSLSMRAECLTELGHREAALATAEAAAELARTLSEDEFAVEDHVWLLNALSRALADVGKRGAALRVAREQVRLLRLHEASNPGRAHPQLALSLVNLSIDEKHLGNPVDAVSAAREGVARLRVIAEDEPLARADLAGGLFELANCLGWVGKLEEALSLVREASSLWRGLEADQPGRFAGDLASALSNEGGLWWQLGDPPRATRLMRESADQLRLLAEERPEQHGPALATVLTNLAGVLAERDELEAALQAIEESVAVHRALHRRLPEAFGTGLALALNNLGGTLFEVDRYEDALAAFREAEALLDGALGYQGALAEVRSNQASSLVELGSHTEALELALRAVRALRREQSERPGATTSQLARALAVQGTARLRTGDSRSAVQDLAESLTLIQPALTQRAAATSDLWEWVGDRYVEACAAAGSSPDVALLGGGAPT